MILRIKNLRLRTIIGVNPWERTEPQSVIINAEVEFAGEAAGQTDCIDDTLDYRTISKRITQHVEESRYQLVETLAAKLLEIVLCDPKVIKARIEVDKPNAIKSADSTSIEVSAVRPGSTLAGTDVARPESAVRALPDAARLTSETHIH